jgi:hypothetical protein
LERSRLINFLIKNARVKRVLASLLNYKRR